MALRGYGGFALTQKRKLTATIAISFVFFLTEIVVAIKTSSLALLADAFHYLSDLIGFAVALAAIMMADRPTSPQEFSFGWARASLLGAFFNGVFLVALGLSIFLQSIERLIEIKHVENPKLVLIMGCVGLVLNLISIFVLHEHHGHDHGNGSSHGINHHSHGSVNIETGSTDIEKTGENLSLEKLGQPKSDHCGHKHTIVPLSHPGHDLGVMGVMVHVMADALNNIGVIIAALFIMLSTYNARYYADPGVSMGISVMVLLSSWPQMRDSGRVLLQSAPQGVELSDVQHDLEKVPGIESVHELHIWRLDQHKAIASAHVVVSNDKMTDFVKIAKTIGECLHAYGIHSVTLQPELMPELSPAVSASNSTGTVIPTPSVTSSTTCQIVCASGSCCEVLKCCSAPQQL